MMEPNVGKADRYIRITLGSLLVAVGAARMARRFDLTSVTVGLLGGMMLAEGVLGTCPVYSLAGIDTLEHEQGTTDDGEQPAPGERTNDVINPHEGI
jgi:hypothetical protein